nr:hypothetical protein [Lachnospiraceae bacterium]
MFNISKIKSLLFFSLICFAFAAFSNALMYAAAENYEVSFNEDNYEAGKAVQKTLELQKGDNPSYDRLIINIEPGTYSFDYALAVYSNTTINATGATIKYVRNKNDDDGRNPIIYN